MYGGLELTMVLPLQAGLALSAGVLRMVECAQNFQARRT